MVPKWKNPFEDSNRDASGAFEQRSQAACSEPVCDEWTSASSEPRLPGRSDSARWGFQRGLGIALWTLLLGVLLWLGQT